MNIAADEDLCKIAETHSKNVYIWLENSFTVMFWIWNNEAAVIFLVLFYLHPYLSPWEAGLLT
jgi:hypothetical protein